jgi:hypothetical protein
MLSEGDYVEGVGEKMTKTFGTQHFVSIAKALDASRPTSPDLDPVVKAMMNYAIDTAAEKLANMLELEGCKWFYRRPFLKACGVA